MPVNAMSEQDKSRTRYHLGFLGTSLAASLSFGIPKPTQPLFMLEDAMNLLATPYDLARVRSVLDELDKIENQMKCARPALQASSVGTIRLHPLAAMGKLYTDSLEAEYKRWGQRLAEIFGLIPNPYSSRYQQRGPGSMIPRRGGS